MIPRSSVRAALVALAALVGAPAVGAAAPAWVPGEVLVGVENGVSAAQATQALGGAERIGPPRAGIRLVPTRSGETVPEAAARLAALPGVEWAEPNRIVHAQALPNDPFAGEQYWLHNAGQVNGGTVTGVPGADADVLDAWARTRGSPSVTVATVDGGVAYDNPDLTPALAVNPGESGGGREANGVDDDGNGFIDDWRGWDFDDDDNDPRDLGHFPHGTAVAGIIGARTDDGYGIAGVAPRTRILPLRVYTPTGAATIADIVAAFGYASRMGARVVNASFGGTVASAAQRDAIAAAPNVLFVASAGNDGDDLGGAAANYPCEYDLPNVICVAATDERDVLSSFSNTGLQSVNLAAPGTGILTTAPPFADLLADDFETPLAGRWATGGPGGTWQRTDERAYNGSWSLTDSPGARYPNNADFWIRSTTPVSLAGRIGCRLDFQYRSDAVNPDGLFVETSTNGGATWVEQDTLTGSTGEFISGDADLSFVNGRPSVLVGLRLHSNGSVTGDGLHLDDLVLRCLGGAPDGRDLYYANGTSFAAPVVSGIAALLLAERPGLTVEGLRAALLAGVDPLPGLAGKVATGGRASARAAIDALPPLAAAAAAVDPARVERPGIARAATTGKVTLRATLAGQATGASGLLLRGATLVRRLEIAGTGPVTFALGRLPAGAYRVTLAPDGAVTSPVDGIVTLAFTVRSTPARAAKRQAERGDSTGATGYRLPATPQPVNGNGIEPLTSAATPVVLTCADGRCTPAAGTSVLGDPVSGLAALAVARLRLGAGATAAGVAPPADYAGAFDAATGRTIRLLPVALGGGTRGLNAVGAASAGGRAGPVVSAAAQARIRALLLAGRGAVELALQDLAFAASRASAAELGTAGGGTAAAAGAKRPALAAPRIAGQGVAAVALRSALARFAASEADAVALSRMLGDATARMRAAELRGDLGGVAEALREAALVAPALGDVVARRPALRRVLAAALDRARVPGGTLATLRPRVIVALKALRGPRGLTAVETTALVATAKGVPVRRGGALPLADALRDPALDRFERSLAAGLRALAASI